MKKTTFKLIFLSLIAVCLIACQRNTDENIFEKRKAYEKRLANHQFSKRQLLTKEQLKKLPKKDRPDLAMEQDFLRTMDPSTGTTHKERLLSVLLNLDQRQARGLTGGNWEERGPLQVGGRTRAVMFDPNDATARKIWAGGVSGGLWVNNDITTANSQWTQVNTAMENYAISTMTFDPLNTNTFYVGTGEGYFNFDAVRGAGIWKTIDGGLTWNQLTSTNNSNFRYVIKIAIKDEGGSTGAIYAATRNPGGLLKSVDGGNTWSVAYSTSAGVSDIEFDASGKIYIGTFDGRVLTSNDNGASFTEVYPVVALAGDRVEIDVADSDNNYVYAIIERDNAVDRIIYSKLSGAQLSWVNLSEPNDVNDSSIPAGDFSRGQAWYDLVIEVNPANKNEVYVGGVNAFTGNVDDVNNTVAWQKVSSWSFFFDNSVSYSHADHHGYLYRPGFPNQAVNVNDGGVFFVPDNSILPTTTTGFIQQNIGYNVTQYYSGALHPTDDYFIGGTQDNGSHEFPGNGTYTGIIDAPEFRGGDGGFCFIDQTKPAYVIASNTGNSFVIYDNDAGTVQNLINNSGGSFINPADYDDNLNILFSHNNSGSLSRGYVNGLGTESDPVNPISNNFSPTGYSGIATHLRVSPYTTASTTLFVGTQSGNVFRVLNANSGATATNISAGIGVTGSVSCVEVGASENELLVTYSNYGVTSVWYTNNGGSTWQNKEGNLPDMPVRWALFNPTNRNEVLLATEAGVWITSNFNNASPTWTPANLGMGNVRVDMLQNRAADNVVLAATHGRGMFTATFSQVLNVNQRAVAKSDFTVFPNPVGKSDKINIRFKKNYGNFDYSIYDISGRLVDKGKLDFKNLAQSIPVSKLTKGNYIIKLVNDSYTLSQKIIKQ